MATQDQIDTAIKSFPETFGLKAFDGEFKISPSASFGSGGEIFLYVYTTKGESFCKGTVDELRDAIVALSAPKASLFLVYSVGMGNATDPGTNAHHMQLPYYVEACESITAAKREALRATQEGGCDLAWIQPATHNWIASGPIVHVSRARRAK